MRRGGKKQASSQTTEVAGVADECLNLQEVQNLLRASEKLEKGLPNWVFTDQGKKQKLERREGNWHTGVKISSQLTTVAAGTANFKRKSVRVANEKKYQETKRTETKNGKKKINSMHTIKKKKKKHMRIHFTRERTQARQIGKRPLVKKRHPLLG